MIRERPDLFDDGDSIPFGYRHMSDAEKELDRLQNPTYVATTRHGDLHVDDDATRRTVRRFRDGSALCMENLRAVSRDDADRLAGEGPAPNIGNHAR